MWQFSIAKDNERHSFLVSIWQGVFSTPIPHIYQVWGIVSSFILLWVRHNLQIDKRNRLHTFFYIILRIGVGWREFDYQDEKSMEVPKLREFRSGRIDRMSEMRAG